MMRPLTALAWRNLTARPARTVLSAIAVATGTTVIVATGVVTSGIRATWEAGENKMAFIVEAGSVALNGVGVLLLAAAGFLIANAFAMTVAQQQREIGLLRSLGLTRRQVLRLVLTEALLTGGLGTLLGVAGGPLLGQGLLAFVRRAGLEIGRGAVSPAGLGLAVGMGLGITVLATLPPARRAAGIPPLAALRGQEPTTSRHRLAVPRRSRAGAVLLAALLLYLVVAPPGVWTGYHPPWQWVMALLLCGVWAFGLLLVAPALLGTAVAGLRGLLRHLGTAGRLAGDNLARDPTRVTLTAVTFAVGLMTIVGVGGFIQFTNGVLVGRLAEKALQEAAWYVYPFDRTTGLAQLRGYDADAPSLDAALVADVYHLAAGRAEVDETYMLVIPETSSPMPGFPTFLHTGVERLSRAGTFQLSAGTWETALPLLTGPGCALLVTPAVAARNGVGIGGTLTVAGRAGPAACTVASLGSGGFIPASLIGPGGRDLFLAPDETADGLSIHPLPGTDMAALAADLRAVVARYPGRAFVSQPEDEYAAITDTSDQLMGVFNGLALLGVAAAALGMVNTTLVSVLERRRELGLLRAVGATRRQIGAIVTGEAALVGLLGALLGAAAGVGLGAVFGLSFGGVTFGITDLPLWWAAGQTVLPALRNGWLALAAAPLLAALAAYPAVRSLLQGPAVAALQAEHRRPARRRGARARSERSSGNLDL